MAPSVAKSGQIASATMRLAARNPGSRRRARLAAKSSTPCDRSALSVTRKPLRMKKIITA